MPGILYEDFGDIQYTHRLGHPEFRQNFIRIYAERLIPVFDFANAKAEEEGVEFVWLASPKEFKGKNKIESLIVNKIQLGNPDESGRRSPEIKKGSGGGAASGTAGGSGVYCATLNVNKYEDEGLMMQCDSSPVTAGELGAGLSKFGTDGLGNPEFTAEATNLNNSGASIAGYLLASTGNLATSTAEVKAYERLLGVNTFAAPVVVTPETSGFDMAFGINQGATIWSEGDSDSNGTENIGGGSGPFQVIVTPTNF